MQRARSLIHALMMNLILFPAEQMMASRQLCLIMAWRLVFLFVFVLVFPFALFAGTGNMQLLPDLQLTLLPAVGPPPAPRGVLGPWRGFTYSGSSGQTLPRTWRYFWL